MSDDLPPATMEEATRLISEITNLTQRRMLLLLIPPGISDTFVKRLVTWTSYCLDVGLIPPPHVPAVRKGDGIVCPYCQTPIQAKPLQNVREHKQDCTWREAVERLVLSNAQIDEETGRSDMGIS